MPVNERISLDLAVCHGRPVVKRTRVLVSIVVGQVGTGVPIEEIMEEYGLGREDVLACVAYAADLVSRERHFPLAV